MAKEREMSTEQILYYLITLRTESARKDSFTTIKVNEEKCKEMGLFSYRLKDENQTRAGRLFLINETQDGVDTDVIYDENGRFIAWRQKKGELQVARDIELNQQRLVEQLTRTEQRERIANETNTASASSSDTSKAGEGRDLATKEHEEKNNNKDKINDVRENKSNEEDKPLKNLKNEINMSGKTRIALDTIINGYYLWEILNLEIKLKERLPSGLTEKSFRNGYLTAIDSKELEKNDGIPRKEKFSLAVCTYSGDIIELDQNVVEAQELGSLDEQLIYENKAMHIADGNEVAKPKTKDVLTRKARFKIPDVNSRFNVNEDWYIEIDEDEKYRNNGEIPSDGKINKISFVQEQIEYDKIYSKQSREARTRPAIKYKLEDANEPPLNEKEQKHMEQLRKKDVNEAKNVRKEHIEAFENVVENLTKKYGESYRHTIEKQVEEEHRKGKTPEEAEKNVNENMDEIENEYYIHGRSRRG